MSWTKTKIGVGIGIGVLLVAVGTTILTIKVKEIHKHRTYPWQINEGEITQFQLSQPPQVRILPSKFHKRAECIAATMVGTGLSAQDVVAAAYGHYSSARLVFRAKMPTAKYDYIACLPGGTKINEKALQKKVKETFGVAGKIESRQEKVWLLKLNNPNAPSLKVNNSGKKGNGFWPEAGEFRAWNEPIFGLAIGLENEANIPVIDQTGLTNRFDFNLNCSQEDLRSHNLEKLNHALGSLGLELVPTNMPIEMLVVEKVE